MAVVTLTGGLGSMGDVASLVARQLGYNLVERQLVVEAADTLGWTKEQADAFDERTGGFRRWTSELLERLTLHELGDAGLLSAYAMTYRDATNASGLASERYIETLRALMTALANKGDVIFVGRGGQALFAGRANAVHVRVTCSVDERVRRIARRDRIDPTAALRLVDEADRQCEAWHRKYFDIDYQSPYHYSLVVNTGQLPDLFAAQLIVEVVEHEATRVALARF